jgi:hypothetical protein
MDKDVDVYPLGQGQEEEQQEKQQKPVSSHQQIKGAHSQQKT